MRTLTVVYKGQGLVEYAIIIALVGVIVVAGLALMGVSVQDVYCKAVTGVGGGGACLVYCSDTFDAKGGWQTSYGNWPVSKGQVCGGPNEGRTFNTCSMNTPNNYDINIDSATLAQGNGYGIFFRASNPSKVNGYSFQYDPGYPGFIIRKWVNGNELSKPIAVSKAPGYDWYGEPHKIKITVNGNKFTAYVDGKPVVSAIDDTYKSGGSGIRTWDNTKVCLGDFQVSAP